MNCPTQEQVLKAAKMSRDVERVLKELFPEAFWPTLQYGEIYAWGTDSDGGCGIITECPNLSTHFCFTAFTTGRIILKLVPKVWTKIDLNIALRQLYERSPKALFYCYNGSITGPKYLKSWSTK